MRVLKADLFTVEADVRCVTTNGITKSDGSAVMGAGLARVVAQKHPWMPGRLGHLLLTHGNRAFHLGRGWASLPTKFHWRDPSDLDLIKLSCQQLVEMADKFDWGTIALPKPGCGLGGLNWERVQLPVGAILDDRFVVVLG